MSDRKPNIDFAIYWDQWTSTYRDISAADAVRDRDDPRTASSARQRVYTKTDKRTRLIPVQGEKVPHFRVEAQGQGLGGGAEETRDHYVVKNVLPGISKTLLHFGYQGKRYESLIHLRYPQVEMEIGSLKLDVGAIIEFDDPKVAALFRSPLVALEVHFSHATESDKLQRLADLNISVLEILVKDRLPDSASNLEAESFKVAVHDQLSRRIEAELLHCESSRERQQRQQLAQVVQRERTVLSELDLAGNRIQNLELTKDRFLDQLDQATAEKRRLMDLLAKAEAKVDELETETTLTRLWRKLIS